MLEGSVDQYSIPQQEKQTSTISMIVGTSVLTLLLPTAAIALLELLDQIEFGSESRWIISGMLFSLTIISILFISGLYLIGFLKSDNQKMISGIYLICLSMLNLLMRMSNINDTRQWYGMPSWLEFMQYPMNHEQLELAFLGIIIGALIMKK
jgi:hypothetical protein|tara:strand:+ start:111 stop:566 length:456 start_codon:yes stop_codon:yes gene_type:complete